MLITTNPQLTLWETVLPPGYQDLPKQLLTGADLADEAFIENADVNCGGGRHGDGVVVTVPLVGVSPRAAGVGCSAR
jgi:hypothetical protein